MQITSKFTQYATNADITQTINSAMQKNALDLNCVRIGIIQEFYPENLTVQVLISGKKFSGINPDGSQILREYPPIYAKVCYCNPFETFPLTKGMECILLFSDREIESWFINGGNNPQAYPRMHDLTDAIAIVGIRSLPNMIQILTDCFHLFYGNSGVQIKSEQIDINSSLINLNGNSKVPHIDVADGASGNIVDSQGKVLATVTNGIITSIT